MYSVSGNLSEELNLLQTSSSLATGSGYHVRITQMYIIYVLILSLLNTGAKTRKLIL